jgi:hypothetical protein
MPALMYKHLGPSQLSSLWHPTIRSEAAARMCMSQQRAQRALSQTFVHARPDARSIAAKTHPSRPIHNSRTPRPAGGTKSGQSSTSAGRRTHDADWRNNHRDARVHHRRCGHLTRHLHIGDILAVIAHGAGHLDVQ